MKKETRFFCVRCIADVAFLVLSIQRFRHLGTVTFQLDFFAFPIPLEGGLQLDTGLKLNSNSKVD
ncbi:MAG: hypothetical protein ACFWT6_17360 [Virgibacillus proomii]